MECPDSVRGICCNIAFPIGEFNIILENVVCPFFDKEKKLCSDYENRLKIAPWCLPENQMFGKGGLPKGCLYLKNHPEKEPKPKVKIRDILPQFSPQEQQRLVALYNFLNNIPFMDFVSMTIKNTIKK